MTGITPDDTPEGRDDGHAFLLLRRDRYTRTVSYYLCQLCSWRTDLRVLGRLAPAQQD